MHQVVTDLPPSTEENLSELESVQSENRCVSFSRRVIEKLWENLLGLSFGFSYKF